MNVRYNTNSWAPFCIDIGVAVLATSRHHNFEYLPAVLLSHDSRTGPARAPPTGLGQTRSQQTTHDAETYVRGTKSR